MKFSIKHSSQNQLSVIGNRSEIGFTIMELVVVIAIIAVITAITVPNVIAFRKNSQFRAAVTDLYANLQKAKLEAVKSNTNSCVSFRQLIGGTTYDYVVFRDDVVVDQAYTATERVIAAKNFSDYGTSSFNNIQGGGDGLSFTGTSFFFAPDGLPKRIAAALDVPETGSIFLTDGGSRQREIAVSVTGFIKIH